MDHLNKLERQIHRYLFSLIILTNILTIALSWLARDKYNLPSNVIAAGSLGITVVVAFIFSRTATKYVLEPIRFLWQAILHVAPEHQGTAAPNLEKARIGKELVSSLALQVYQLASSGTQAASAPDANTVRAQTILANIPLPLLVMNKNQSVIFANPMACTYIGKTLADIQGKNMYSLMDMSFPDENTLDTWLSQSRSQKLTASTTWTRVRMRLAGENQPSKQFDMAAYYNQDNPNDVETIVAIFDRTTEYTKDDTAMSFVALAVHELRTPLTILRGYIEVLEDELEGKLDPEMTVFMQRMRASAQQLSSFVSNILNVARVDENQLTLQLHEENWQDVLQSAVNDITLRAQVRGKTITCEIQPNLPTVAVDRISIYEVITNLLDNAIKYSTTSDRILVKSSLRTDGFVETLVQDFGIGIPSNIVGNLFEKFYRNHRSSAKIGGTGLGLYLSKAIVTAHGGQIWVRSEEGKGSIFGFTLQQYSQLADELKNPDNSNVTRSAHGWIKNHSFYRR